MLKKLKSLPGIRKIPNLTKPSDVLGVKVPGQNKEVPSIRSTVSSAIESAKRQDNEVEPQHRESYKIHIMSEVKDRSGNPITVSAYLPEELSMDYSSEFRAPFTQNPLPGVAGDILRAFSITGIVQEMTYQVWDGSQGLHFNLPLVFYSDDMYDADIQEQTDVNEIILKLLKLVAPSKRSGSQMLTPPGPTLKWEGLDEGQRAQDVYLENFSNTQDGKESDSDDGWGIRLVKGGVNLVESHASGVRALFDGHVSFDTITTVAIGNALRIENVIVTGVSQSYDVKFTPEGKFLSARVNFSFRTTLIPTMEDLYRIYGKSSEAED